MASIHGNSANNQLNGTSQADDIHGGDGHDTLNGGGGADTLIGGTGNDVYVTDGLDTLVELAGEGVDEVRAGVSFVLPQHFENLRLQGNAPVNGTGNTAANILWGNNGANVLDGGGGNDTMRGGAGNDTYITDGGDTLVEIAGQGVDEVRASVSHQLLTHFENLVLTGSAAINGTGNAAANVITGNAGDNVLDGGAGIDTVQLTGTTGTQVVANLAAGTVSGHGQDTVLNFENVRGTEGSDVITGHAGANLLDGAGGSDEFFATAGVDTIVGGEGNDAIRFDHTGAVVVSLVTGTYSLGAAGQGTLSSITHVQGSAGADAIDGNGDRNHLGGAAGDDTIISGGGDFDIVWGGTGSDRLVAAGGIVDLSGDADFWSTADDDAADVFVVLANAGTVTISDFQVGVDKLDLSAFGFDASGTSATWTASASFQPLGTELQLLGPAEVTILLQGLTQGQPALLGLGDLIGGSPALIPPGPVYPPSYGANGVADVWVIDPTDILNNHQGVLDIVGFEDGLDRIDLSVLELDNPIYWYGQEYPFGPTGQTRMEFWGLANEHFVINLIGHAHRDLDLSDVIL